MWTTRGPGIWELSEQSVVLAACALNPSNCGYSLGGVTSKHVSERRKAEASSEAFAIQFSHSFVQEMFVFWCLLGVRWVEQPPDWGSGRRNGDQRTDWRALLILKRALASFWANRDLIMSFSLPGISLMDLLKPPFCGGRLSTGNFTPCGQLGGHRYGETCINYQQSQHDNPASFTARTHRWFQLQDWS